MLRVAARFVETYCGFKFMDTMPEIASVLKDYFWITIAVVQLLKMWIAYLFKVFEKMGLVVVIFRRTNVERRCYYRKCSLYCQG